MIVEFTALFIVVALLFREYRRPNHFPPGPKGLPLVGYFPFVAKLDPYPFKAMIKLSNIYGPVVGFFLGPRQPFVSVCGYEAVKEALQNYDLNGRPSTAARRERTFGKSLGVMFVEGDFFREQRRFTLRNLRDFGFGKTSSEQMIHEEIHDLISSIELSVKSQAEGIVDFENIFNMSMINILWAIVGGERFSHQDIRLKHLLGIVELFFRSGNLVRSNIPVPGFILRMFPKLRELLGLRNDIFLPLQDFIRASIQEHENDSTREDPRDFIGRYLSEIERQQQLNPNSTFQEDQLIAIVIDLFIAGGETTSNAIGYALLYLLRHPDAQLKMQLELDKVCGDSLPSMDDRSRLPYTEAVLMEAQRLSNITATTIPHVATSDTQLQGYIIPKGSIVVMNLYSVHLDASYWSEPEVFKPERHLSSDGTVVIKTDHLIPFGAGKRMCLGESLARNTYYLFTAALIKTFQLKPASNQLPPIDPLHGFTNGYKGFKAIISQR